MIPPMTTPINVLYLHCHDAGRALQPYGWNVRTPHLRRLAEEGVLFRQAHCANPTCSPSRAALLSGRRALNTGMLGLAHRGWAMDDYGKTMMSVLRGHGYETVLCGQQHIAPRDWSDPGPAGYEKVLNTSGDLATPPTVAEEFLAQKRDRPFFLDVGFFAPHRRGSGFPRSVAPPDERYLAPPPTLPDTPETRRDFALYAASAESADHAMGRVLDALDGSPHADNTLVVCTTDHGIAFPGMKCRLTDHGTGVMLIMRGPGGFSGGKAVDAMVSHIDVFPTVFETLGLPLPDWLEGRSFLPVVRGEAGAGRDAVFAEVNYHAAVEPMRGVRTSRWKYIRRFPEASTTATLPNIDNSLSKLVLYDHGLAERAEPAEWLFDLVFDPRETRNLAEDPGHESVLLAMAGRLDAWMRETGDPLVDGGALPRPEGIVDTDAGAYAPNGASAPKREGHPWTEELRARSPHAPEESG